jgi:hypothetical protein
MVRGVEFLWQHHHKGMIKPRKFIHCIYDKNYEEKGSEKHEGEGR